MPDDEGFRRYMQAGMAWFSVTQQKAEAILRDLTDSGETAMGQAQKVFDRIVERGRQGTDELRDLVRAEIREQIGALGLATRDDIARLEAKIDAVQAAPPSAAQPDTAQPDTAQPDTAQPDTAQPDTAQPDTAQPDAGAPPAADQPDAAAPTATPTTGGDAGPEPAKSRNSSAAQPPSGTAEGAPPRSSPEEA